MTKPVNQNLIVQISDTHLFANPEELFNNSCPYKNLNKVIEHISSFEELPGLVIATGDISNDYSKQSYKLLDDLLVKLGSKYIVLPGNHDDLNTMKQIFSGSDIDGDYSYSFNNWSLYFLNTAKDKTVHGELTHFQLKKLSQFVESSNSNPIIIFMHHHPIKVQSSWIDKYMLKDSDAFMNIVTKSPNIKAIFFGHIHQVFEKKIDSIFFASVPAVQYQFLPNSEEVIVESLNPGYRKIHLNGNEFTSEVVMVS